MNLLSMSGSSGANRGAGYGAPARPGAGYGKPNRPNANPSSTVVRDSAKEGDVGKLNY